MLNSLKLFLSAAVLVAAALVCLGQQPARSLFMDPNAPLDKRVDDLLSRMTLAEKVSQLQSDSPAIDRLGVPAYNWWNECLHGIGRAGRATVFPQAIGLAATWDTNLMFRVATTISDEARAKHHEFARRGKRNIYQGLTFWTPNINLFRDPRWGRGMETYGEDPFLTARLAVQFIKGLQGDDPKYLKTVATAKHFAVHSGPEPLRHTFDAVVDPRDLYETYLPHFEAAIKEAGAFSVMCAYNRVDGFPACASPTLLENILRKQWGFGGYVVSDCGAIEDIYRNHKTSPTPEEGVARAVKSGTDLNCGVEYDHLLSSVRKGLITEAEIGVSVRRLLIARFKLGLFDPPSMVKYARIPYSVNDSAAHRQVALETARKSIVLLKNENRALPLSKSLKTIAVIGPNADDAEVMVGNYNGDASDPVTPLQGIRRKLPGAKILYARGSELAANLPHFEVIPTSALFTSNDAVRKPGLNAEYYATANFDGVAHRPREMTYPNSGRLVGDIPANPKPLFTRVDAKVDFRWWDSAPRQDMKDDDFGVRWTGYLSPPVTGAYQLGALGMNAFELYLDGKQLLRFNNIHHSSHQYAAAQLEAGKLYQVRLDFHEYHQDASIQLLWSRPEATVQEAVQRTLPSASDEALLRQRRPAAPLGAEAIAAAKQADAVVMVLGLSPRLEGEEMRVPVEGFQGGDRVMLGIPRVQEDLLQEVAALGKPLVLVLLNGSAVSVTWARDHVPAIVELWYPGQAGGTALADVLFGDYNPAGRLPVTFYKSADQLPAFTEYAMKGKTYRFFEGEPLFPFGHGLSYTSFAYRNLSLPAQAAAGEPVTVRVEVENTGAIVGDEVVQLYLKASRPGPIRSLEGFQRVSLRPRERRTVEFTLTARQFASVTNNGRRIVSPGVFEIAVGGKQPGFRGILDASTTSVVTGNVQLTGAAKNLD